MTEEDTSLALHALYVLGKTPRQLIFARRQSVVAAVRLRSPYAVAFRRVDGGVRMEVWSYSDGRGFKQRLIDLPKHLQQTALKFID